MRRPEATALNLADRLDALVAALRDAGVSTERSAALLASAATATMHAVTIDALLHEEKTTPVAPAARQPQRPIRLAA